MAIGNPLGLLMEVGRKETGDESHVCVYCHRLAVLQGALSWLPWRSNTATKHAHKWLHASAIHSIVCAFTMAVVVLHKIAAAIPQPQEPHLHEDHHPLANAARDELKGKI